MKTVLAVVLAALLITGCATPIAAPKPQINSAVQDFVGPDWDKVDQSKARIKQRDQMRLDKKRAINREYIEADGTQVHETVLWKSTVPTSENEK